VAPRQAPTKAKTLRHHWIVRVTHWVNALALVIMIGSGLRGTRRPSGLGFDNRSCRPATNLQMIADWINAGALNN
jgi:hypothetical protein